MCSCRVDIVVVGVRFYCFWFVFCCHIGKVYIFVLLMLLIRCISIWVDKLVKVFHNYFNEKYSGGGRGRRKYNVLPVIENPVETVIRYIYKEYEGDISLDSKYLCRVEFEPILRDFVEEYNTQVKGTNAQIAFINVDFRIYKDSMVCVPLEVNEIDDLKLRKIDSMVFNSYGLIDFSQNGENSEKQKGLIVSKSIADAYSSEKQYIPPKEHLYLYFCEKFRNFNVKSNFQDIINGL